jgi:hypothetical protein
MPPVGKLRHQGPAHERFQMLLCSVIPSLSSWGLQWPEAIHCTGFWKLLPLPGWPVTSPPPFPHMAVTFGK